MNLLLMKQGVPERQLEMVVSRLEGQSGGASQRAHISVTDEESLRDLLSGVLTVINKILCLQITKKADLQCSYHKNDKYM